MKIEVTASDIKNGERESPSRCPIARALKRSTRHYWLVHEDGVRMLCEEQNGSGFEAWLPKKADTFVRRFDEGWKVRPFSFHLRGYTRSTAA